ncbi:MAG: hypothetical protein CMG59_00820 [Candidatus Marinimicrobia bacterium]|nr:hypothetical protein [Candidatus Neomarinimicrobiota bacterium]
MKNIFRIIIILNIAIFSTSCSWLNEDLDSSNETESSLVASVEKKNNEEALPPAQEFQEKTSKESEKSVSPPALQSNKKIESHYGILIEDLGMQIKKLRSELDFLNQEVYALKAQSQVWENPFSIYNKEIVLDNGTTVYGKIVYQDQEMIKVETLIGGLTIDRSTIVKVTENVVEILPKDSLSSAPMKNFIKEGAIIEIQESSPGSLAEIERKGQKKTANLIVLGSIYEKTDENGNTILSGEIKNIGKKRADFSKINFLFRMNWRGETKPLTSFAKGTIQDLGNGVISDASIEPESIGNFELFIPKSFGEFISYSYSLDWEQYE